MGFILNLWGFCCKNEKFVSVTFSLKNNCSHFPIFRKMEVSAWEFSSFNFSTPKSHQKLVLKHVSPTTTMIIAETCRTRIWISNVAFGCLNRPACLQSRYWFSGQNEHGNHFIRRRCPRRSENPWFLPNYSRMQQVPSGGSGHELVSPPTCLPSSPPTVGEHSGNAMYQWLCHAPCTLGRALWDYNNTQKNGQPFLYAEQQSLAEIRLYWPFPLIMLFKISNCIPENKSFLPPPPPTM